ncbi:PREDICTED: nuclear pore complex protein Nup50 isoform X2 [Crocodylus porosus]|uniref:nuclear pore complex protein Nup50 isoform X2 n=1 Tax=Crocodylus porosus TaxID=8502 RepID=UPI0009398ABE|nr:PREDICTED: nuclear pore complex protein Nup50 isoform X2 [Crocodylus porosus]
MAKRIAEKELTDRNWDQEDEAEESESGGAFKGFKGFIIPSAKGGGGFTGFGNGTGLKPLEGLSNGSSGISNAAPLICLKTTSGTPPMFGSPTSNGPTATGLVEKKTASPKANGGSQQSSSGYSQSKMCNCSLYYEHLTALNCSVRDWIVKHVNTNPLCDLTPIFRDYEKYLANIEQQYGSSSDSGSETENNKTTPGTQSVPTFGTSKLQQGSTFLFNSNKAEDASDKKMESVSEKNREPTPGVPSNVSFNFGKKVDSSVLGSLGSGTLSSFSFSPGNSRLFGKDTSQTKSVTPLPTNVLEAQTESGSSDDKGGDEDEEEPPKVVVNEIKEDDAFYSKKCKLFYKKNNEFKEKGIGTLHLKPAGNEKTQLLVRADTNLGNILLNVLIPPKMPCTRTGKNNVLIVCVPNPPIDEKNPTVPITILIRVKTSEDADELHKILLEKKEA